MGVACPVCGGISRDPEFCDHCNTDLAPPTHLAIPPHCPLLLTGTRLTSDQRAALSRPASSLALVGPDGPCRVHWLPDVSHWLPFLEERARFSLKVLPVCKRLPDGGGMWLVMESTGKRAEPWCEMAADQPRAELRRLQRYVQGLACALEELHAYNLVWLNFDPAELEEVTAGGANDLHLQITNMDLEVYPAGYCPERLTLKPAFAAPEVCRGVAAEIGPRTNVFHLALFTYYWLARRLPAGFPGAGLESFHFRMPLVRAFAPDLPPGLVGILKRGLAVEPRERFATPGNFAAALDDALERIDQRWAFAEPVAWDIGAHTRAGLAKSALKGANEDCVLVERFAEPARALVAVADGITTCDIGSGALASSMTMDFLRNSFNASCQQNDFPSVITMACDRAAHALLDWAIDNGYEGRLRLGLDLMGTTLCAAWLQGHHLRLATIGDSRAYLVNGETVEQLTVDGDLGSGLLAAGTPPEQVRDLGGLAKALRECIGGCYLAPNGELQPLPECFPTLSQCPLFPGDTVILCSDGLVEEGAFLDPDHLLDAVRHSGHLSAQELADHLADLADGMQRPPSPAEAEGFGDNISCIVIKVLERAN